jgi:hypothetical protein
MTTLQRTTWSACAALLVAAVSSRCQLIATVDRGEIPTNDGSAGVGGSALGTGGSGGIDTTDASPDSPVTDTGGGGSAGSGIAGSSGAGGSIVGSGGTTVSPDDSGLIADVSVDDVAPIPDATVGTDASTCGGTLPAGWNIVVYSATNAACDTANGYTNHNVQSNPATPTPAACQCTCRGTTAGDCDVATISALVSPGQGNDACSLTWFTNLAVSGTSCVSLGAMTAGSDHVLVSVTQGTAIGGACTSAVPTMDTTAVTATQQHYCDVPAAGAAATCGGTAPTGFSACIIGAGNVACTTAPYTRVRYLVQDGFSLSCPTCTACTTTTTCTAPTTISGFTGTACAGTAIPLPANGVCSGANNGEATIGSILYSATAGAPSCTAGTSTPGVTATNPRTICCR